MRFNKERSNHSLRATIMRYLFTLACLLLVTATVADEPDFDFKSNKAKAAVQKYQDASQKSNKRNLDSLIRSLEAAFKHERTEGDFDEAIKIRDAIKALEKGADPAGASVAGSKGKKKAKKSKARIPKNAVKWNGHHYWVSREKMTWHLARDYCESLGGHLLRIESPAENTFVSNRSPEGSYWIDVSDAEQENVWTNSKREPLQYTNWAPGQPNGHGFNPGNAHAGYFWNGDGPPHGWYNYPSDVRWEFICEWDE